MKKLLCMILAITIIASACVLAACDANPLNKASKNCDNYDICMSYDPNTQIVSATQITELTNRADNGFESVKFHIYANQYRQDAKNSVVPATYKTQAYRNGESWGDIAFDSVKVNGNAVAFTIEGEDLDILSVPMSEPLLPNQKTAVEMTYQIQLANIAHRLGYNDSTVNLGNFYPIVCHVENDNYDCSPYYNVGDPFVSEVANYNVSLTLPGTYVVAASGNLTDANQDGNNVTYKYTARAIRDFAMVFSNKYKKITQTVGDTQVNYYYYNDMDSEKSLDTAVKMMEFLNKNVGKYPYEQYSVCETEFCYGGMEYPNLVMVTSGSQSYTEAIAHETAHQWFYGVVGDNQIANAWMDEGLSDFLTYLYLDEAGVTPLANNIKAATKTYVTYVDVLNRYYENVNTGYKKICDYRNDGEYVIYTYVKGSLMFNTLYETMGRAKFFKALKDYYNSSCYTIAEPEQMLDCFTKAGGTEIGTIFTNFVEGKEILGQITD